MYKVIFEKIDKTSGYCKVIIQTKEGKFTGTSCCHPEDAFSPFVGIRYAERRAVAAWCKRKAKLARVQLQTVIGLKNDFIYNNLPVPKAIKIKIRDYTNDVKYWTETAKAIKEYLIEDDKRRADILSRYSHTE